MMQGIYTGTNHKLAGKRAILRQDPDNATNWLAQFDLNQRLGELEYLCGGWHPFPKLAFKVET